MNIVLLGATRGIGRALARQLAARGDHLVLLGRGAEALQASVVDLQQRYATQKVSAAACDLADPETFSPALDSAERALGTIDAIIVTAALFGTQADLEQDLVRLQRVLTVDYVNTVLFCEHARKRLTAGGVLMVFSSVAGDRGRKPVGLYGSAKAGLSRYLEALDHQHHSAGLRVVTVKPGFVRTEMTAGLKEPPFASDPEEVAAAAVAALDDPRPVIYTPSIWRLVMLVIQHLPRVVMRRVGF